MRLLKFKILFYNKIIFFLISIIKKDISLTSSVCDLKTWPVTILKTVRDADKEVFHEFNNQI